MRFNALPTLETQSLILRAITLDDAPAIFAYAKDPEVCKLLSWHPNKSVQETEEIVQGWLEKYKQNKSAPWGIIDKISNQVIGTIDVRNYNPTHKKAEIGYCLSRDYWGRGLMVQAVRMVVDYLFSHTAIREVNAYCRIDNPQSQRVLEKAGFIKQPKQKREYIKDRWIELIGYSIRKYSK